MKKYFYILLCGLLSVLAACEKDTAAGIFAPEVTTGTASGIYRKGATLSGSIRLSEGMAAERYGIRFSGYQSMGEYHDLEITDGSTEFQVLVKDLEPGKTYYFCTYAYGGYSTVLGEVRSFTTSESNAPMFSTPVVSGTTEKSFVVTSELLDDGGSDVMLSGFCYNEAGDKAPNFMDRVTNVEMSGGTITATIRGVAPLRTYQIRAYGASVKGLAYSGTATVTTEKAIVPFLSPVTLKDSTLYSMTAVAKVLEQGSSEVTAKGFCWSTDNPEPTVDDNNIPCRPEEDEFSIHLEDLSLETTYYICAYAVNEYGTGYSEVFAYSTAGRKLPELSATTQTASTDFSVSVRAEVADGGIPAFTQSGFCWSVDNPEPTTADNTLKLDGQALEMTLDDLEPATTYYIRAYATNEVGTAYGEAFAFTTADAKAPEVSAVTQTASGDFSVSVRAEITDAGTADVTASGFCWSTTNKEPTTGDSTKEVDGTTLDMTLDKLEPSTTYYIRAYATNEVGTTYSEVFVFTTADAKAPSLSGITQTASGDFSVSVRAEITDAGTSEVTASGFCWSTANKEPTTGDNTKEVKGTTLTMTLDKLEPATTYYIRAYATNGTGTTYSEVFTFTTADAKAPTLSAVTRTASSNFSVSVKADVTDEGTSKLTKSGFCWSTTNQAPTTDDSKKELNTASMTMTLDNLDPGTTYYIRAYATNEVGTTYSGTFTFTAAEAKAPTVSAVTQTASSNFSVSVKADVTDEGTSKLTASGFCWSSTSHTPTVNNNHKELNTVNMTHTLDNLDPGTTYYIRAYATNEFGTTYGEVFSFTTAEAKAPTLSVITQTASADFSVSVKADVTDGGTSEVTQAGFCWSATNQTPTTGDSKKELSGTALAMTLENLNPGTTYYIRAYAVNKFGTSYSEVFTFTTAEARIPVLSAITQTASSNFSVSIRADVTDGGTSAVTASGFCWSITNQAPTTGDSTKELGGTSLATTLDGLQPGTTYYIRAYATNQYGTAYSEVFTFTTAEAKAPTVSDITQTASSDFSVSVKAAITDAGTSAVTQSGFCWSTTNPTPTVNDSKLDLTGKALETTLSNLQAGTTYYIRAYAVNEFGTTYSKVLTFKTAYGDAGNGNTGIDDLPTNNW